MPDTPYDICVCGGRRGDHTDPNAPHQFTIDQDRLDREAAEAVTRAQRRPEYERKAREDRLKRREEQEGQVIMAGILSTQRDQTQTTIETPILDHESWPPTGPRQLANSYRNNEHTTPAVKPIRPPWYLRWPW